MEIGTTINIDAVINSSDELLKKEVVDNYSNYDISLYDVCHIIESIDDDEFKIKFLNALKQNEFSAYQVVLIASSIKNETYKKEIVKSRKEYGIDDINSLNLISSMNEDAINDIVNNYKEYRFSTTFFSDIVCLLKNDEIKKRITMNHGSYSLNNFDVSKIVASINDDSYKKVFINKFNDFGYDSSCIAMIVKSINDDSYKYSILNDYKKYNFSNDDVLSVVSSLNDAKYIYKVLDEYKAYGFDLDTVSDIVMCIDDDSKKVSIITQNVYNFNPVQLTRIVNSFNSASVKEKLMEVLYKNDVFGNVVVNKTLVLPDNMSIGVEIESEGINSDNITNDILPKDWIAKRDSSLQYGIEVTSPVLYKGNEDQIYKVCSMLQIFDQNITDRCAGHVHIGSNFFEGDVNSFKNLLEIFANTEGIMYLISNQEGDIPRDNIFKYSVPISKKVNSFIKYELVDFSNVDNMTKFTNIIKLVQGSRFASINFKNLGVSIKDTIEFRVPNGTIDADVWIDNINLFGGLMCVAKNISSIQKKSINDMTDSDKIALYFYEKLKDPKLSERNRLKFLLNLLPDDLNKQVYLNRFDVNRELSNGLDSGDLVNYVGGLRPIVVSKCSDELKTMVIENYQRHVQKSKYAHKLR